jgi:hypothetical protein
MPQAEGRTAPALWHASADAIVATIAGSLAILVFYPITLCAAGVKHLVRMARPRPHAVSQREEHRITQ